MAAPITATDIANAYDIIYINLHSLSESGAGPSFFQRLTTWRADFFPLIDVTNPLQVPIRHWAVPTSTALGVLNLDSKLTQDVDPLLNLLQNTLFATSFNGYTPPSAQDTAMTDAFNAAWT